MMSKGLTFRRAQKEDLPRISEFLKSFSGDDRVRRTEPEHYEWRCFSGPLGEGDLWIAEDGDRVVGMQIATLKNMKILKGVMTGAKTGDSFTHPQYQRRGISTTLAKAARDSAMEKGASLLYTTTNRNSFPVWKRAGYEEIPSARVRALARPLNIKQLLKARLHSSLLAAVFSPVINIAFKTIFKLEAIGIAKSHFSISRVSSLPDDIDGFWERASQNYDVMLVRNKKFLQWRYIEAPEKHLILIARGKEGGILGYIVALVIDLSNEGQQTGVIADFLAVEDNPRVFKNLVLTLLGIFYKNKVSQAFTWAIKGGLYYRTFLKLGFLSRSDVPLMCFKNELGNKLLSENYKWHFTMGDSDNI